MSRVNNPNLLMLETAVQRLGALADEFVFLGGCATGLLISDPAAPPIRETIDVDVIVQVLSRTEYYELSKRLREQGFREDMRDDAPICRWVDERTVLDVMPTDPEILSFGNRWHAPALENAGEIEVPSGKLIRMVTAPYFLITKIEAFEGRGKGDFQMSHDIEDLVAVLDGRPMIADEVAVSDESLSSALAGRFRSLLGNARFVDAVYGHLPTDPASQARVPIVMERMQQIANLYSEK